VRADGLHLATISGGSVTDEVIGDSGYDGAAVEADDRGCIQAAGIGDEAVDYFFNCGDGWQTTPIDKSIHDSEYVTWPWRTGRSTGVYAHRRRLARRVSVRLPSRSPPLGKGPPSSWSLPFTPAIAYSERSRKVKTAASARSKP
jgi:hypothetical protein